MRYKKLTRSTSPASRSLCSEISRLLESSVKSCARASDLTVSVVYLPRETGGVVDPSQLTSGRNKLIINHLGRLFVTNDAATIIKEIEVAHPAAKLLVMAAQAQEAEMGDATNLVLIFAGELLKRAEHLLTMGLHPSEVIQGYEMALEKGREELESECYHIPRCRRADNRTRYINNSQPAPPIGAAARCCHRAVSRLQAARI